MNRISLDELRAMTDPGDEVTLCAFEVLALIEAVESAHAAIAAEPTDDREPAAVLIDALARFDFGGAS